MSHPNFAQIFASYIDRAMEESGIPLQQDFASGHLLGRQYAPLTISYPDEERSSSQSSYPSRALRSGRTNFKVYPNMLAKRVIFNDDLTAMGVEVVLGHAHEFRSAHLRYHMCTLDMSDTASSWQTIC